MTRMTLIAGLAALGLAGTAHAQTGVKIVAGPPASPISRGAILPAGSEIFFVSGIPGSAATGDTAAQTAEVLGKLGEVLKSQGYDYKDVVNMKVYLVGDPAKGGAMDFAGMNGAFKKVFGTEAVPTKPSRVTVQVAGLAAPGSLVEIELTAAKAPK